MAETGKDKGHRWLEGKSAWFAIVTTVAIAIGGLVEIVPMFTVSAGPELLAGVTPYTPLEVAGRDIYIREGCYTCHSQMVRPTRAEELRYGPWTRAGEYAYDHPFLLGSRRIGPDLQRVGGTYPDAWHYEHMRDPRSTSPGSIMPPYARLLERRVDSADVTASVRALRRSGVPYSEADVAGAAASMRMQGTEIVSRLAPAGLHTEPDREIVAMIAYLQRLGRDGKAAVSAATTVTTPAGGTTP
jgi:cytochrome c oxidase cbb3-type subunit I/II